MSTERQNVCSATLIVLGTDLDPDLVSHSLGLTPDRAWKRGERQSFVKADGTTHYFDSHYERGGWKSFLVEEELQIELVKQIEYWCATLKARTQAIRQLQGLGYKVIIDCCIVSDTTEFLHIGADLQKVLGDLQVDLDVTFYSHRDLAPEEV
jgi:hypothetical protein